MFGKEAVRDLIAHSTETEADRRVFMKSAGVAGLGLMGAGAATALIPGEAQADVATDLAVLNFALNLEYLEAEFYLRAVTGKGLPAKLTGGKGEKGGVLGGRKVNFATKAVRQYAEEIAQDELAHVKFLRSALGGAKVARPAIDIKKSFTAGARAAGLIGPNQQFDAYKDENSFLLAAFLFEDVGVTAYKGASPLVSNKAYLEAAAGILAVEAYHAGIIRTTLYSKGLQGPVSKLSAARDSVDGGSNDDFGIGSKKKANLVPTDSNSIAFSRSADRVLNVVYLTPKKRNQGGFFPKGVNGAIHTSGGKR